MWSKSWVRRIKELPRLIPRTFLLTTVFLLPFALVIVAADYVGFFGIKEEKSYVLHEVHFRLFDRVSMAPIQGARARCFQLGSWNACTQKETRKPGRVIIKFSGTRTSRHTLFFDKGSSLQETKDPMIQVMLLHTEYVKEVQSVNILSHLANPEQEYKVTMQPVNWGDKTQTNEVDG